MGHRTDIPAESRRDADGGARVGVRGDVMVRRWKWSVWRTRPCLGLAFQGRYFCGNIEIAGYGVVFFVWGRAIRFGQQYEEQDMEIPF